MRHYNNARYLMWGEVLDLTYRLKWTEAESRKTGHIYITIRLLAYNSLVLRMLPVVQYTPLRGLTTPGLGSGAHSHTPAGHATSSCPASSASHPYCCRCPCCCSCCRCRGHRCCCSVTFCCRQGCCCFRPLVHPRVGDPNDTSTAHRKRRMLRSTLPSPPLGLTRGWRGGGEPRYLDYSPPPLSPPSPGLARGGRGEDGLLDLDYSPPPLSPAGPASSSYCCRCRCRCRRLCCCCCHRCCCFISCRCCCCRRCCC